MKRISKMIISLLLVFAIVSTIGIFNMNASAWSYDKQVLHLGDTDRSGSLNAKDALSILKYTVGKIKPVPEEEKSLFWDANENGTVNAEDALLVLKIAVGKAKSKTYTMLNTSNASYNPCKHIKISGNYKNGSISTKSTSGNWKIEVAWTSNTITDRKFTTPYSGDTVTYQKAISNGKLAATENGKTSSFVYQATTASFNSSELSHRISIFCFMCDKRVSDNIYMHVHY